MIINGRIVVMFLIGVISFTVLTVEAITVPNIPDLPIPANFGVQTHVERYPSGSLPKLIRNLKNAGFGWMRTDLLWENIEKRKGEYEFQFYDKVVDSLKAEGIHCIFELDFTNPNYDNGQSPISDEGRAAFARFAVAAVKRYVGKQIVWEIYNEPNLDMFWKPKADVVQYLKLADLVTEKILESVPQAAVIGPAISGPLPKEKAELKTEDFLNKVLKSEMVKKWSSVTIHPYRSKKETPESVSVQLQKIRRTMLETGIDPEKVPVVISEWGYSTWESGVDEKVQAAYAVRSLLWGTIEHMPFTIWYDWADDGTSALNEEFRFGLARTEDPLNSVREKPALIAIRQVGEILRGYRYDALIKNDDSMVIARFTKGEKTAYGLWSKNNREYIESLSLRQGNWEVKHLLNQNKQLTAHTEETIQLNIDQIPTFVYQAP